MRFRDDQLKGVLIYDQRIFCRWRYRYGGLDEEPPAPDLESLRGPQKAVTEGADCAHVEV
jgi:hypothetical protein